MNKMRIAAASSFSQRALDASLSDPCALQQAMHRRLGGHGAHEWQEVRLVRVQWMSALAFAAGSTWRRSWGCALKVLKHGKVAEVLPGSSQKDATDNENFLESLGVAEMHLAALEGTFTARPIRANWATRIA